MLGFFKGKSKDNIIYSPCKGKVVPITEVSDPTFSEKVLGDGFAVIQFHIHLLLPCQIQKHFLLECSSFFS